MKAPSAPADRWLFLAKFLRHGTAVGSVTPSSGWMARKLIADIDFSATPCIVELGAGTGSITAEVLRAAAGRGRVLIVERDPDFCALLRQRFAGAEIVEGDALELDRILTERHVESVGHVLCGLALPWFPPADRHRLLDTVRRRLTPAGSFRQLTYMPWIHAPEYRRYFEDVGFRWVFLNLPPGGFYLCRGPRPFSG